MTSLSIRQLQAFHSVLKSTFPMLRNLGPSPSRVRDGMLRYSSILSLRCLQEEVENIVGKDWVAGHALMIIENK